MPTSTRATDPMFLRTLRFASITRNGVLIALGALCAAEILHALRPTFTEPRESMDFAVRAFVYAMLWIGLTAFVFALAAVLGKLFDPPRRKLYSMAALAQDSAWLAILVIAAVVSHRYGWFFK